MCPPIFNVWIALSAYGDEVHTGHGDDTGLALREVELEVAGGGTTPGSWRPVLSERPSLFSRNGGFAATLFHAAQAVWTRRGCRRAVGGALLFGHFAARLLEPVPLVGVYAAEERRQRRGREISKFFRLGPLYHYPRG